MDKEDAHIRSSWGRYGNFPARPTYYNLSSDQQTENYGLQLKAPLTLDVGVDKYIKHCMASINTDRGPSYIESIQTTSVQTIRQVINGFMGFCYKWEGVPLEELRLSLFANPQYLADFVGYLMARDVGHAQIAKQVGYIDVSPTYYYLSHNTNYCTLVTHPHPPPFTPTTPTHINSLHSLPSS